MSTPISDAVEQMLSAGVPVETLMVFLRNAEKRLQLESRDGVEALDRLNRRRAWDRNRKQNGKQNSGGSSGGKKPRIYSSSINDSHKLKEQKNPRSTGNPVDDWPADFGDQFWAAYPQAANGRNRDRAKVYAKLEKLRRDGFTDHTKTKRRPTWADLFGGLSRYAATSPNPQYVPAPLVWLNGHRWLADYSIKGDGDAKNGNGGRGAAGPSFAAKAAARRVSNGSRNGPAPGPNGPAQSARGLDDAAEAARRSGHPAFDVDDGFEPGDPVHR